VGPCGTLNAISAVRVTRTANVGRAL